jgi:hypothetical protein
MRISTWTRRLTAMLGILLIPLLALATTGAAQALPLAPFADTSVSVVGHPFVDEITSVTDTSVGTLPGTTDTLTLSAAGFHGPLTWSVTSAPGATADGYMATMAANVLTLNRPAGAVPSPASFSVVVDVTDGPAVATAVEAVAVNASDQITGTVLSAYTVTLPLAATNNTDGTVDFGTLPTGVTTQNLGNAPAGVTLASDGVLSAGTAIPGIYNNLTVQASHNFGAGVGADAVETLNVLVKGSIVHTPVPVLSHGHAVCIAPTREDVYYVQSGAPSWDHFQIVGPGAINGHEGWVYGHLGLNVGVYSGLEAHHTYDVFYTPVEDQGSDVQIPGTHTGHVTFVTDENC